MRAFYDILLFGGNKVSFRLYSLHTSSQKKIINGKVKKLNLFFKSNIGRVIVFIGKPKISEEPSEEDFLDFEIESSEVEIGG